MLTRHKDHRRRLLHRLLPLLLITVAVPAVRAQFVGGEPEPEVSTKPRTS